MFENCFSTSFAAACAAACAAALVTAVCACCAMPPSAFCIPAAAWFIPAPGPPPPPRLLLSSSMPRPKQWEGEGREWASMGGVDEKGETGGGGEEEDVRLAATAMAIGGCSFSSA